MVSIKDEHADAKRQVTELTEKLEKALNRLEEEERRLESPAGHATYIYATSQGDLGGYLAVVAESRSQADRKAMKLARDNGIEWIELEHVLDQDGRTSTIIWDGAY
jgi:hypothetical protein